MNVCGEHGPKQRNMGMGEVVAGSIGGTKVPKRPLTTVDRYSGSVEMLGTAGNVVRVIGQTLGEAQPSHLNFSCLPASRVLPPSLLTTRIALDAFLRGIGIVNSWDVGRAALN